MNIGIIIPAYNEADSIELTLESLLKQSFPAYQIIVVDDGSTDATAEIVSRISREYPVVELIQRDEKGEHFKYTPNTPRKSATHSPATSSLTAFSSYASFRTPTNHTNPRKLAYM